MFLKSFGMQGNLQCVKSQLECISNANSCLSTETSDIAEWTETRIYLTFTSVIFGFIGLDLSRTQEQNIYFKCSHYQLHCTLTSNFHFCFHQRCTSVLVLRSRIRVFLQFCKNRQMKNIFLSVWLPDLFPEDAGQPSLCLNKQIKRPSFGSCNM